MNFLSCPICDQIFVKLVDKKNSLTCCDTQVEELIKNNKMDQSKAHQPVIRQIGNFLTISISEDHPMIDTHHISVIFLETNKGFQYKNISLEKEAKAEFILANEEEIVNVYIYCNVHLVWSLN